MRARNASCSHHTIKALVDITTSLPPSESLPLYALLKRVHTADQTRQNWSVANILKTTENCRKLLKTVANSVHTADADPTKQFCGVGVGGVKWVLATRHIARYGQT